MFTDDSDFDPVYAIGAAVLKGFALGLALGAIGSSVIWWIYG